MRTRIRSIFVALALFGLTYSLPTRATAQTGKPAPPKSDSPDGQKNPPVLQKVAQRGITFLTIYPDLAKEKETIKSLIESIGGPKLFEPKETDSIVTQLKKLQLASLYEVNRLDEQVLMVGSWDVPFLNQRVENTSLFANVGTTLDPTSREHGLVFRKLKVVALMQLESVVWQRVFIARNLREQQYHQVTAYRLAAELELYEYEFEAKHPATPTSPAAAVELPPYGPLVSRSLVSRRSCFCR